ncbi:MAG: UDP-N-acetylmuramoyl-tripeptide--D-alanyl-D-alanine ligase [Acidobacteria bacterium]|nr:UDP-N-acetylmuramoyl-tripeptide--D-alanyl-D-alanine ligase [Acidobacteriota bacterium]
MLLKTEDILKNLEIISGRDSISNEDLITGFSIDTRTIKEGEVFIAIKGENIDGSNYIDEAITKGAAFAITGKNQMNKFSAEKVLITKDSTESLQKLGRLARDKSGMKFVGITGSAGKTTTKEFTHAILSGSFNTGKTWGNFNNLYGLPLCLANMQGDEEVFVGEMGMSYAGELTKLVEIADPDVGVILNVHPVHTEHFNSIEDVARAKAELFAHMKKGAIAVYNSDNKWSKAAAELRKGKRYSFGILNESDVMAWDIRYHGFEGTEITLVIKGKTEEVFIPRFGLGNVYNFLAAVTAAHAAGAELNNLNGRLEKMAVAASRGNVYKLANNITLVDDSYNSNPVAMEMLLRFIERYKTEGRKVIVAGDMLELGRSANEEHMRIGKLIANSDIDFLVAVGDLSKKIVEGAMEEGMEEESIKHFESSKDASAKIGSIIRKDDFVLVKGSNSVKTSAIVKKIQEVFK